MWYCIACVCMEDHNRELRDFTLLHIFEFDGPPLLRGRRRLPPGWSKSTDSLLRIGPQQLLPPKPMQIVIEQSSRFLDDVFVEILHANGDNREIAAAASKFDEILGNPPSRSARLLRRRSHRGTVHNRVGGLRDIPSSIPQGRTGRADGQGSGCGFVPHETRKGGHVNKSLMAIAKAREIARERNVGQGLEKGSKTRATGVSRKTE